MKFSWQYSQYKPYHVGNENITPILNYVYISTHTGQETNIGPVIYKTQVTILEF